VEAVSDNFVHVVKKGESLGSIARKYHVTVAKLKKWNHLKRDTLHVGQRLTIYRSGGPVTQVSQSTNTSSVSKSSGTKSTKSKATTTKTHTVKKGETLSSISRKYGCTVNDLKKWNGLKSNTVRVGQKLKIKK
jgi:LysM repeat protein